MRKRTVVVPYWSLAVVALSGVCSLEVVAEEIVDLALSGVADSLCGSASRRTAWAPDLSTSDSERLWFARNTRPSGCYTFVFPRPQSGVLSQRDAPWL